MQRADCLWLVDAREVWSPAFDGAHVFKHMVVPLPIEEVRGTVARMSLAHQDH